MKVTIITLFPQVFAHFLETSILKKAQDLGKLQVELINLRDFGLGPHRQVDDRVYGGGVGMVLRVEPLAAALKKARGFFGGGKAVLLTPQGETLKQEKAKKLSREKHLILICGKYEGVDERIRDLVDEELSIGDYILSGGEVAALTVLDTVARLLPGVLEEEATELESFSQVKRGEEAQTLLEPPQYTRPESFKGKKVPEILLSGNHQEIKKWREEEAFNKTKKRRPDLLGK